MSRVAIVGIHDMTTRTAGRSVIAGLIVGAHEPGEWIIEARLVNIDKRYSDTATRAGTAIRLPNVGLAGFLEALNLSQRIRQPGLRKQVGQVAAAVLEDAKNIAGLYALPGRQGIQFGDHAMLLRDVGIQARSCHLRRDAIRRVALAEDVILERQYAVVVSRAAPEHHAGRHHAADVGIDDLLVTGAAGLLPRRGSPTD